MTKTDAASPVLRLQFVHFLTGLYESFVEKLQCVRVLQFMEPTGDGNSLLFFQLGQFGNYFRYAHVPTLSARRMTRNRL